MAFLDNLTHIKKPQSYHETKNDENYVKAMEQELDALDANHIWKLTNLIKKKRPMD